MPLLIVFVLTFAVRAGHFGDPDIDCDETFYLLVGDRMLHGIVPYIDLWDRKPVGLFVLYAMIRALGGAGFVQYQAVAAAFVAATAGCIWAMARRWAGPWPAVVPAIAYVIWLEPFHGQGGQTASFYNLPVIAAMWLVLRARDSPHVARDALTSMLLIGAALQVKYTALPEGLFCGLAYLWLMHRQGMRAAPMAAMIVGMVVAALLPTLIAAGWYWHIGHLGDFVFANFVSIHQRGALPYDYAGLNLLHVVVIAMPLIGVAVLGIGRMSRADRALFAGWLIAAGIGFVMIGNFYINYFLPVLVPLTLCGAANLAERRWGIALFCGLIAWPFVIHVVHLPQDDRRRIAAVQSLTAQITPHIDATHCLYVFDGPASLYMTTHSCLPTRFPYPDHLTNDAERPALGVDATAELLRVLARHPGAIVTATPRISPVLNAANVALMQDRLAHDYYPAAQVHEGPRLLTIWAQKRGPGASQAGKLWHADGPINLYGG